MECSVVGLYLFCICSSLFFSLAGGTEGIAVSSVESKKYDPSLEKDERNFSAQLCKTSYNKFTNLDL